MVPLPLPVPRPPTPPAVEPLLTGYYDENSDQYNPEDPFYPPDDSSDFGSDYKFRAEMAAADTFADRSVAGLPSWSPSTVMPLSLRPYMIHLVFIY